jgi:HEAT repeat protein
MARARQSPEELLAKLSELSSLPDRTAQVALVKSALADRSARVVAKAATLCSEQALRELTPEIKEAYSRLLVDAVKRDPQCLAKQSITRALVELDCSDVEFFQHGIRYHQLEPVWGGSVDTAVEVRSSCAMGLVASGYWRALPEVTALLADKEVRVREGAARAISCGNPQAAEVLLRFKVLTGDKESAVIGECFTGLMAIAADECVSFVAEHLRNDNDEIRDFAALALGESRHPEAVAHLKSAWDTAELDQDFRIVLIRAAAVHRSDAAFEWLLSLIENDRKKFADAAVDALAVYERNTKLAAQIHQALANRQKAPPDS